ncbi:MAG: hypothetical protein ACT4P3_15800, partial [Betaproteobacteria bacterium]
MKWFGRLAWIFFFLLLTGFVGAAWLLGTESGLRWALERAQAAAEGRLAVEGASGVLAGTVRVARIAYETEGFRLESRNVRVRAGLLAALGGRISLDPLEIDTLQLVVRPGGEPAASAPSLPWGVSLGNLAVEQLEFASGEQRHLLREVRLAHLQIDRALSAEGSLRRPDERFPLDASFTLKGSLERIEISSAAAVASVPIKARLVIRPFAEPRLEALEAQGGPVDLARFDAALPRTAISASLEAKAAAGGGLAGTLFAANAAHGPLDADQIPVARLETRFASPDLRNATLERLLIVVSGGGTLEGKGELGPGSARAELRAAGIVLRAFRSTLRATRLQWDLLLRLTREEQL